MLRLESLPEYRKDLNTLNDQYDGKYEENKQRFIPIGRRRARRLKPNLDFGTDLVQITITEIFPWLLKEGSSNTKKIPPFLNSNRAFCLKAFRFQTQIHRWIKIRRWCWVWTDPRTKSPVYSSCFSLIYLF